LSSEKRSLIIQLTTYQSVFPDIETSEHAHTDSRIPALL